VQAIDPTNTKYPKAINQVYQAYFSPQKYEGKTADLETIQKGRSYRLPYADGEIAVTTWGERGPAVLLMHGWGGARAQMAGLVDPLLAAGYRVVAYDQPAHGESDGVMTNLLEIVPSMDLVLEKEGTFEAILAHSFGTLITSYALVRRSFPLPERLVYFGALNRLMDTLPRFQTAAGLPDTVVDVLRTMMYETFEKDLLEALANEVLAPQIDLPAWMYHDTMDPITPIQDSRAIARVWHRARLFETTGLGHRGALQSEEIQQQVVGFLNGG
jgi:pimeloyl-ACP methyl ester carboxylesterase